MKEKAVAYISTLILVLSVSLGILLTSFNRVKAASGGNITTSNASCSLSSDTERGWK